MIIDIETVVFRQPVVQIGVLPEKLLTRVREADGWLVTLDTEAGEVTLVETKGDPICVPVANVLCYTRRKVAAPAEKPSGPKDTIKAIVETFGGGAVLVDNKAANARGKR